MPSGVVRAPVPSTGRVRVTLTSHDMRSHTPEIVGRVRRVVEPGAPQLGRLEEEDQEARMKRARPDVIVVLLLLLH
jgi:hypothetical protein